MGGVGKAVESEAQEFEQDAGGVGLLGCWVRAATGSRRSANICNAEDCVVRSNSSTTMEQNMKYPIMKYVTYEAYWRLDWRIWQIEIGVEITKRMFPTPVVSNALLLYSKFATNCFWMLSANRLGQ